MFCPHTQGSCVLASTLVQSCSMSTNTYNYYIKWLGYICTSIQYFTEHTLHAIVVVYHEYRYMNTHYSASAHTSQKAFSMKRVDTTSPCTILCMNMNTNSMYTHVHVHV